MCHPVDWYNVSPRGDVIVSALSRIKFRLVNDYDFDHDPTTDCKRGIIRIFDYNRLRMVQQDLALEMHRLSLL